MPKYLICTEILNSETYHVGEYSNRRIADEDAWQMACEAYQGFEGIHGVLTYEECEEEGVEYNEEIDSNTGYYVVLWTQEREDEVEDGMYGIDWSKWDKEDAPKCSSCGKTMYLDENKHNGICDDCCEENK